MNLFKKYLMRVPSLPKRGVTRFVIILFAFLSLGLTNSKESCTNFLFYHLPLNKNTFAIRTKMLHDTTFKIAHSHRSFFHTRHVEASIKSPHTYLSAADSANLNMNLLSWLYYGNKSRQYPMLKKLELTLYFKNTALKNAEYDTLVKLFNTNYTFIQSSSSSIYSDGPNGKDTVHESTKLYFLDRLNRFPELELSKNLSDKKHCYIKLIYQARN